MLVSINTSYILVPDRVPCRADATVFRYYWQRQRLSRWCSRALMRQLAHDYWVARRSEWAQAANSEVRADLVPAVVAESLRVEWQPVA